MCIVLSVSRSAYYDWLKRLATKREKADEELAKRIRTIFEKSRKTYGHRRVKQALKQNFGVTASNDRIRRLMRDMGLVPVHKKKFKATTNSNHSLPIAPNLLKQNFQAVIPRQVLVGDITYIPTEEGWLYLATVVDLFSRKVVGWALGERMTKELVIKAMERVLHQGRLASDAIFHSDRGSQYASYDYQALLSRNNIRESMSARGDCHDNACAESFFATLKKELIHRRRFVTRSRAKLEVFDYILWYNNERLHSSFKYWSPTGFENLHLRGNQLTASA